MAELRTLTRTLAQHIQMLTLQIAERDAQMTRLQDELAQSPQVNVIELRRLPRDGAG